MASRKSGIVSTILFALALLASACTGGDQEPGDITESGRSDSFNDHTVAAIDSLETFNQLAATDGRQSTIKFSIPDMANNRDVYWMDSDFYQLHDEWYWFRLLNGQPVPAIDVEPVSIEGQNFETIADIYSWHETLGTELLPLDLRISGDDRIYADRYYLEAVFVEPGNYGVGSLLRFETDEGVRWLFELEHEDEPTVQEVGLFFDRLSATLPSEIGDELAWVARSPQQETTAREMEASGAPYSDRIVRYSELVKVGEVGIYNEGVAAGRLRIVSEADYGISLADATDDDLVIVESIPDWLPPAAAIISSSPQTPLAHVNLLARNRGIPNASLAGITDHPGLQRAAASAAPAVVHAADGELTITLLSETEYKELQGPELAAGLAVPAVDLATTATVVDLTAVAEQVASEQFIDDLRPVIGGKSAGFLTLLNASGVTAPQKPLAITVKPYFQHLAAVQQQLDAILADPSFQQSPNARFLLLEGEEEYADAFPSQSDANDAIGFMGQHREGTVLGDILAGGGFMNAFRDVPMDSATLAEIEAALQTNYGDYSQTQGIRFRSSSSVEDLEGFSGAGLYDSNTGFINPEVQEEEKDQKKSVEYSIKKTWASYWSFEAFEERSRESVDHSSGGMGVLTHARFDDPLEQTTGVATFTILPDADSDTAVAMINVQAGDVSVTNPDPDDPQLPEIIEMREADSGDLSLNRLAASTLADGQVIDDAQTVELFTQLREASYLWLDRTNLDLSAGQQMQTVTLDFEFKHMAPGWPARAAGVAEEPARLVVKQVRSLDPGLRGVSEELLNAEIPRDVLARAKLVDRYVCSIAGGGLDDIYVVYTSAQIKPDMGYSDTPLIVSKIRPAEETPPLAELQGCPRSTLLTDQTQLLSQIADDVSRAKIIDSADS